MSENLILQYLQSIQDTVSRIDQKQDGQAKDIAGLKEAHAHIKGVTTTAGVISMALAGIVAWVVSLLRAH